MPSLLSYKCLMLFFIPICLGYSCHKQVSSGNSTWKLCVISTHEDKLRFKIKGFFSNFSGSRWLSIGFPKATQEMNYIPFFLLLKPQSPASIVVQVCQCLMLVFIGDHCYICPLEAGLEILYPATELFGT